MQRVMAGASDTTEAILNALAALGADALKRDGWGRNTLWYCRSVADAGRLIGLGLDIGIRTMERWKSVRWGFSNE